MRRRAPFVGAAFPSSSSCLLPARRLISRGGSRAARRRGRGRRRGSGFIRSSGRSIGASPPQRWATEEFLSGALRLRGPAKALDLQLLMRELSDQRRDVARLLGASDLLAEREGV